MAIRIDGKAVSAQVRARVAGEVAALREKGVVPGLAVIIVGDDPASRVYVNNKKKACAEVGIRSEEFALPADTTQLQLMALVHQLNERKDISGILCQLPLPFGRKAGHRGHCSGEGCGCVPSLQCGAYYDWGLSLFALHACGRDGAFAQRGHFPRGEGMRCDWPQQYCRQANGDAFAA